MKNKIINTSKYIFSGGMSFLINISIFWVLINYTIIWYVFAAIISFTLSALIGYILHKNITYSDRTKTSAKKMISYYIFVTANVFINSLIIFTLVESLNMQKILALMMSNLLIAIYSYKIYKKIIFR